MNDGGKPASEINRELTSALVAAGIGRGFHVITEYPVPGGRLDVVWCSNIEPPAGGIEGPIPIVAFEIESSWRTRKHVKGDLLNILDAGAAVGVIVLADSDPRDESLLRFARALIERPGPQLHVWTRADVLALSAANDVSPTPSGDSSIRDQSGPGQAVHTGKYRELWRWLTTEPAGEIHASFTDIEDRIGIPLPPSCRRHAAHWSSYEGSAVARALHDAGWRASRVDLNGESVTLSRVV